MSSDSLSHFDGRAAAGALPALFTADIMSAIGRCSGCGRIGAFAENDQYLDAPGLVIRCPGCDHVLMRVVMTPGASYLDLRGLTYLKFAPPSAD